LAKYRSSCISLFLVAPQIGIGFTFGEDPLNAGDMATITCAIIKGDSPLDIDLMFKSSPIEMNQSDVIISASGKRAKQLMIEAVQAKHAGTYTCIASNSAGSVSRSTILAVNGTVKEIKCIQTIVILHSARLVLLSVLIKNVQH
jgi:hypothetical protein